MRSSSSCSCSSSESVSSYKEANALVLLLGLLFLGCSFLSFSPWLISETNFSSLIRCLLYFSKSLQNLIVCPSLEQNLHLVANRVGQVMTVLPVLSGKLLTQWLVYSLSGFPASKHTLQQGFLVEIVAVIVVVCSFVRLIEY